MKRKDGICKRSVMKYVSLLLASVLVCALCACGGRTDAPEEGGTRPVETVDLTDAREITPTDEVTAMLSSAFADTPAVPASDLTYETGENGVTVTGYTGGEIVLKLPDTIDGKPVTAVAEGAFKGMVNLRAVSLPDSVTSVGAGAFEKCTGLATLRTPVVCAEGRTWFGSLFGALSAEINASSVPGSLSSLIVTRGETIPDDCFFDCHNLTAVSLPDTLTKVGAFAFYGCSALVTATLPAGVTEVGAYAFANCPSLLNQCFGSAVTSVGQSALEGCMALETLTLPFVGGSAEENTFLGYLFGAKSYTLTEGFVPASLIRVTLLEGCDRVPDNAFFECSHIREVVLPASVRTIGQRAFYRCAYLARVNLPDGVTLGTESFRSCLRLTSVDLSRVKGLDQPDGAIQAFADCRSLKTVTLPAGVTALPSGFFSGCDALEK